MRQAEAVGGGLALGGGGAHAHLVRGDVDGGAAIGGQGDPRRAAGHAVVGIGAGGAAHADQPLAVPDRGRAWGCAAPSRSARPRRARPRRCGGRRRGGRRSGPFRARCGGGARSGRCRARRRARPSALSRAKVPTASPGARMKVLESMSSSHGLDVEKDGLGGVGAARRHDEGLGEDVVAGLRGDAGVDQCG